MDDVEKKPIKVRKMSELSDSELRAITGFHTPAGRKAALEEVNAEYDEEFVRGAGDYLTAAREKTFGETKVEIVDEVDPLGIEQHEPGAKLDCGKPDCSLLGLFGLALLEVAKVGTFGASKYTRGGWQYVPEGFNRYSAAMLRHHYKEHVEPNDPDSSLSHAAHVAWNALARLELMQREKENIK